MQKKFTRMSTKVAVLCESEELEMGTRLKQTICVDETPTQATIFKRKQIQARQSISVRQVSERRNHFCGLPLNVLEHVFVTFEPRKPNDITMLEQGTNKRRK
jgi:hypothetical protein